MSKNTAIISIIVTGFIGLFIGWSVGQQPLPFYRVGMSMGGGMMGHGASIRNDADFLMEMIPHHQEAVETSRYVLSRTNDAELMGFLQGIIDAQTTEIEQMKRWHKEWFGTEYKDDGRYRSMMPNLNGLTDKQLAPAYLQGMIMHHMGAIDMARTITSITNRQELKDFSATIIRVQSDEIEAMLGWLSGFAGGAMPMMVH
ncbi:DUF305 domain-containing protein [Candidatus Uhrbacteria bacterium]|nr:DUF305 domain-containing protein [Candidatus Uhrbacteria bacterium]